MVLETVGAPVGDAVLSGFLVAPVSPGVESKTVGAPVGDIVGSLEAAPAEAQLHGHNVEIKEILQCPAMTSATQSSLSALGPTQGAAVRGEAVRSTVVIDDETVGAPVGDVVGSLEAAPAEAQLHGHRVETKDILQWPAGASTMQSSLSALAPTQGAAVEGGAVGSTVGAAVALF